MTAQAPGHLRGHARPPISTDAAPVPGAEWSSPRVTALPRPWISPRLIPAPDRGYAPDHPSARRFWIALLGPAAVADLLRLVAAARTGRRIRRPLHLGLLVSEGLVVRERDSVLVPAAIPPLSPGHRRRLRPALRAEYRRVAGA